MGQHRSRTPTDPAHIMSLPWPCYTTSMSCRVWKNHTISQEDGDTKWNHVCRVPPHHWQPVKWNRSSFLVQITSSSTFSVDPAQYPSTASYLHCLCLQDRFEFLSSTTKKIPKLTLINSSIYRNISAQLLSKYKWAKIVTIEKNRVAWDLGLLLAKSQSIYWNRVPQRENILWPGGKERGAWLNQGPDTLFPYHHLTPAGLSKPRPSFPRPPRISWKKIVTLYIPSEVGIT